MLIEMSFIVESDGAIKQVEIASQDDNERILSVIIIGTTRITILAG